MIGAACRRRANACAARVRRAAHVCGLRTKNVNSSNYKVIVPNTLGGKASGELLVFKLLLL